MFVQLFGSKSHRIISSVSVNFQDKNSKGDILGSKSCNTEKNNGQIPNSAVKFYVLRDTCLYRLPIDRKLKSSTLPSFSFCFSEIPPFKIFL